MALYVFWCSQVGAMAAALLHSAQCLGEEDDATSAKLPKRLALGSECTRQSNVKAKDDDKNALRSTCRTVAVSAEGAAVVVLSAAESFWRARGRLGRLLLSGR